MDYRLRLNTCPRGSVWWWDDKHDTIPGVQKSNRPVLVISNDLRGGSTVVEVCTITSRDKQKVTPKINIQFINHRGEYNYIQCNQHFVVPIHSLKSFIGMIPTGVMNRVEEGLMFAQGLSVTEEAKQELKKLEGEIANTKQLDLRLKKVSAVEQSLSELSTYIHDRLKKISSEIRQSTVKPISNPSSVKIKSCVRHKTQLTSDQKLQYIIDYEEMPLSDLMKKWDLSNKNTARNRNYRFKKELGV